MSADGWATCPVRDCGGRFREDWEIGLNSPANWLAGTEDGKDPCIIINYTGECQVCSFTVRFNERRPVEVPKPVNEPIGPIEHRAWSQIPALWYVQTPKGDWLEVAATSSPVYGVQRVTFRFPDGRESAFDRRAGEAVPCRAGTLSVPWETMRDGLGAEILEDRP